MSAAKGTRFTHLAPLPGLSGLGVLLLLAAVIMTTAASGRLQASAKADFSLSSSPTSQSAQQGQVASYTVTEQKVNGFNATVTLTASNLPAGTTGTFNPQTLSSNTSSVLALSVGTTTTPGTYPNVTITGTGGSLTHSFTVTLVVTAAPAPGFTLTASPSSATLLPGGTGAYSVATSAVNGFTGSIAFSVSGAPAGSTSTFSPTSVAVGGSSSLQVATKNTAPAGTYNLTITGTSGSLQQTTTVALIVTSTGKQFTITSPAVTLPSPGSAVPLNLSLYNPNNQSLQVTNLTIAISSVTKAASAPANSPCTPADYAVTQFSGTYPLTLGAGQTLSLSALVISSAQWPRLSMLNTSSNQDGCKGATVLLAFSGTGQG